jgi:hypothetical protein
VALYPSKKNNLLTDSQKLLEFDSLNALLDEGTNHYNKKPFIPLSKKNSVSKTRERNPPKEKEKKKMFNMKNGRMIEVEDNLVFVDVYGETALGSFKSDAKEFLFSNGKLIFFIKFL